MDAAAPSSDAGVDHMPSPYTSLVQKTSETQPTVLFPQWMVETWRDTAQFGASARRLFLPENNVKTKLPLYKAAVLDPALWTRVPAKLEHAAIHYRRYGHDGRFVKSSTTERRRGKRFDMPEPGLKSIIAANIVLVWALSKVTI